MTTFNRFLIPYIIGPGGAGTKKVLDSVNRKGYVRCGIEEIDGELVGVARMTTDPVHIDILFEAFCRHMDDLVSEFCVPIDHGVVGRFLFRGEMVRKLRRTCCGGRFCTFFYSDGRIWCQCLKCDAVALEEGVRSCVADLHADAGIEVDSPPLPLPPPIEHPTCPATDCPACPAPDRASSGDVLPLLSQICKIDEKDLMDLVRRDGTPFLDLFRKLVSQDCSDGSVSTLLEDVRTMITDAISPQH